VFDACSSPPGLGQRREELIDAGLGKAGRLCQT
jgi:hypothetical protein